MTVDSRENKEEFWRKLFNSPETCKFFYPELTKKKEKEILAKYCARKAGIWPFTSGGKCSGICKDFKKGR